MRNLVINKAGTKHEIGIKNFLSEEFLRSLTAIWPRVGLPSHLKLLTSAIKLDLNLSLFFVNIFGSTCPPLLVYW